MLRLACNGLEMSAELRRLISDSLEKLIGDVRSSILPTTTGGERLLLRWLRLENKDLWRNKDTTLSASCGKVRSKKGLSRSKFFISSKFLGSLAYGYLKLK